MPSGVVDEFTHEALSVLWTDALKEGSPFFRRKAALRTLSALAKSSLVCTPGKGLRLALIQIYENDAYFAP